MSNPTLIELREDTSDSTLQAQASAGEYQVTLNNPVVLRNNDELSLSSVFVDSVATNSGKIVIDPDETEFEIRNFLYLNNYEYDDSLLIPFKRTGATLNPDGTGGDIVLGLNDGFDYVACSNGGTQTNTSELITQISLGIRPHDAKSYNQSPTSFHFTYKSIIDNKDMTYVITIPKDINLQKEIDRAGINPNTKEKNPAFYNMDDFKADMGDFPSGFPLDCVPKSFKAADPFSRTPKGFDGFNDTFNIISTNKSFTGVKLVPHIQKYNFTIPAGAYDPSEFARIMTDKLSSQNIQNDDGVNFTDKIDDNQNKYVVAPRSFSSPYLNYASNLAFINQNSNEVFGCRSDGEGIIRTTKEELLFGSTQVGMEFDIDQNKFYFSQLHSPFYITSGTATMGTKFTNVINGASQPTLNHFVANKTGGVGFVELKPSNVWFDKLGFNTNVITNFGVRNFDGAGRQHDNYQSIAGGGIQLGSLSPITFDLNDGINTTGNFTSLDSAVNKSTPRVLPDLATLQDTSQIIKQIYAERDINQSGSLPYYLIEIDGKGINSDIRGGVESAIQNTKISAIVSRYYQTESYTSSMDGSGAIPYIHKGEPLIIDSFRVRILDPDGTLTDNIQNSNVVFLQHTPAQ